MKTIILDDNTEYVLLEEIMINNTNDITLRKTKYEDNESYYVGLDSKEEVENVLMHISRSYLTKIKESEE